MCLSVAGKLVSEWDCLAKFEGGQYCTLASYYGENVCATSDYKDINGIFLSYSLNKISIYLKQLKYCPASSSGPNKIYWALGACEGIFLNFPVIAK